MDRSWSLDSSFNYYKKLLHFIKNNYNVCLFHEVPQILRIIGKEKPKILLRHDVDLSIDKALEMAEIENEAGIHSCYMLMTHCPFYSLNDKSKIIHLKKLGHEIALHFDYSGKSTTNRDVKIDDLIAEIDRQANLLEEIISSKVEAISFHRPVSSLLLGPLFVGERVNAYSSQLMNWYLSDSKGSWRGGEPLKLLRYPKNPILQMLVHPFWWGDTHISAANRLEEFFQHQTMGLSTDDAKDFDNKLSSHLTITRSGK